MTALPPIPNKRVVGLKDGQIKLLRKLLLNPVCAHPECDKPTEDAHHCFPRSTITNDSWYVEITEDDGSKKVLPHVTGLCREHHQDVEEHRAWIRLDDEWTWNDYSHTGRDGISGSGVSVWSLLGPLTPQPGEVQHPKKKTRKRKKDEDYKPNDTVQKNLSAPKFEMEVFLALAEEARVLLERPIEGRKRWLFYTLLEVLTVFVQQAERIDGAA